MFNRYDIVVRIDQAERKIYKVQERYTDHGEDLYLLVRHLSPTKPRGHYAEPSNIVLIDTLIDEWHSLEPKNPTSLLEYLRVEEKDFEQNYLRVKRNENATNG